MICRALCVLACTSLAGCTLLIGHEDEQDLAVPDDMSVPPMDASSTDLARNFAWTASQQPSHANLNGVWAGPTDGGTVVYVVGDTSTVLVSEDEGDSWQSVTTVVADSYTAVWGRSASDVFIGGQPLAALPPAGEDFVMQGNAVGGFTRNSFPNTGSYFPVVGLWSAGPGEPAFATANCAIYSTDGTGTWSTWGPSVCNQTAIWGTSTEDAWTLVDPRTFHSTSDVPNSFVDVGVDFTSMNQRTSLWGFGVPGTTQSLWVAGASATVERHESGQPGWTVDHSEDGGVSLHNLWGESETDLYAVGDENTILHRTAAGWIDETIDMPTKVAILSVFGLPSGRVVAVGEFGWIFVRKPE